MSAAGRTGSGATCSVMTASAVVISNLNLLARIALMGRKKARAEARAGGELSGVALAGALVGTVASALPVGPISRQSLKKQHANRLGAGHVAGGGPFLDALQHFDRKTNLHFCANRLGSLSHSSLLWLGLGPGRS